MLRIDFIYDLISIMGYQLSRLSAILCASLYAGEININGEQHMGRAKGQVTRYMIDMSIVTLLMTVLLQAQTYKCFFIDLHYSFQTSCDSHNF